MRLGPFVLIASGLLAFAAGPAFAADRDVRMPLKAAPAAGESYAWSGFYVGAHAGYAFGSDNYEIDPAAAALFGISNVNLFGSRGFSGGVLAGYNVPFAQRWLVGIEADWSKQDIATRFEFGSIGGTEIVAKQDWTASLRGRLGYFVTPGTLVYGTAGWAWSKVDISIAAFGGTLTSSGDIHGVQVGGGVETAITPNLHARLEYLQTFYDTAAFSQDVANFLGVAGIKPTVGLARLAAVYQFGGAAPMAQAEPAAAAPVWTGFYLAGSLGGAMGYGDVSFVGAGDVKGVGLAGPIPSVIGGVNFQFAPRWLVGAEAEVAPSIKSTDLKLGWLGAVRGRLGFLLMPDTLVYGTVGWTGTQVNDLIYQNTVVLAGQYINGVQFGGGVEAAFADHWSARVDYQYSIFNKVDLTFPVVAPGLVVATGEPRGHIGRIAIVRRFGG
jgi:outer membrane immunogenic protein